MTETTIAFARISISPWAEKKNLKENLSILVKKHLKYKEEKKGAKFFWVITESNQEIIEDEEIIYGELNKIREEKIDEVFDEEKWEMKPIAPITGAGEEKSRFLFFSKENILVFEEKWNIISIPRFIKVFKGMYQKVLEEWQFGVIIVPIIEKREIYKIIESWNNVIEVKFFNLWLPNPETFPAYKKAEEILRDSGADESSHSFKSQKKLNIGEKSIIDSMIALSDAGYGDYEIKGIDKNGTIQTRTKGECPIKVKIKFKNVSEFIKNVIKEVKKIFQR